MRKECSRESLPAGSSAALPLAETHMLTLLLACQRPKTTRFTIGRIIMRHVLKLQ